MSLVICSNQEKDGKSDRQDQSIYNAWSFRNPLSSTMTIPANSQVALQSCKVNVDGRVVFSRNNQRFYHYFGDKLELDGTTEPQIDDSTSYPAITHLMKGGEVGSVVEMSVDDFADRIQDRVRSTTYHPNQKELFECTPLRNASGLDFLGYNFNFKQNASDGNVNSVPGNGTFENYYHENFDLSPKFTFENGVFKKTGTAGDTSIGICKRKPFSLTNGSFVVNVSNGSFANVNASKVEWTMGLSRAVNKPDANGYYYPRYSIYADVGDSLETSLEYFADFNIGGNTNGDLIVYHFVQAGNGKIGAKEIQYWNNPDAHGDFTGDSRKNLSTDLSAYTKYGFFSNGEDLQVKAYHNGSSEWRDVINYPGAGENANTYFKPVNQACWCLHPVLGIGTDLTSTQLTSTLQVEEFSSRNLTTYAMPTNDNPNSAGWWELMEYLGTWHRCQDLEMRDWNDPGTNQSVYSELNLSGGAQGNFVMVLEQSEIYRPTFGANGRAILGFGNTIIDTPNTGAGTNSVFFESTQVPSLTSSLAMFVRLNNFGQSVVNAHQGNNSKIIAHLPRFDNSQSTGRLYFEPNQMVFIDLNNPAPLQVNEFDISFSYINEQYATILSGQSIVALYFRKKPKELM